LNNGWIALYRQTKDHWLFKKNRTKTEFEAWVIMLWEVNHSENKVCIGGEIITCKRGESVKSLDTWAKEFGWTKSKVRRFLKLLESDSMIELISERKTTHLKICNYESYQDSRNTDEPKMKRKRNNVETMTTPNNNDNNVNNDNNIIHPLKLWIKNYAPNVDKLKEPLTDEQCNAILKKADINLIHKELLAMHNYKKLLTSYISANLTLQNWINRELEKGTNNNGKDKPRGSIDYDKYERELATIKPPSAGLVTDRNKSGI
jgi:DNA replication protein DnaD